MIDAGSSMETIRNFLVSSNPSREFKNDTDIQYFDNEYTLIFAKYLAIRRIVKKMGLFYNMINSSLVEPLDESALLSTASIIWQNKLSTNNNQINYNDLLKVYQNMISTIEKYHFSSSSLHKVRTFLFSNIFIADSLDIIFFFSL